MPQLLAGLRILIVEDEFLAALELQDMVQERGGTVVGPVARLDQALELARTETLDAGLLDAALDGSTSYPLADKLMKLTVPVIFVTGYASDALPDRFASTPRLGKPVSREALERAFRLVFPHF